MRRLMKRVKGQREIGAFCIVDGDSRRTGGLPTRSSRKCCRCLRSITPIMGRPWPVRSCRSVIGLRYIPKPCGYGCGRRDCPTNSGKPDRIGSGGRGGAALARWCRWTDRIMTGWKGEGPKLVLMGYIDDATSTVEARFYDHEGTVPALDSFRGWVQRYGIPCSVYLDKHTTYRSPQTPTVEEQLQGHEQSQSQFQRAMSELGVEVIHAHSPAAKGRVERLFQTLQDRLVKELRLAGASTLAEANQVLQRYLPLHNQRFQVEAAEPTDLHRRVPAGLDLNTVLCLKTQRRLNADSTVQHEGHVYLVEDRLKAQTVMVHQRLDGSIHLRCHNRSLSYRLLPQRPRQAQPRVKPGLAKTTHRPAAEHPWRGSYKRLRPERHSS